MKNTHKVGKYVGIGFASLFGLLILAILLTTVFALVNAFKHFAEPQGDLKTIQFSEEFTAISNLNLKDQVGELKIKAGETLKVEGSNLPESFEAKNEDGTLYINTNVSSSQIIRYANTPDLALPTLTITLPAHLKLEDCTLSLGMGSSSLSNINTNTLSLDMGAGFVVCDSITAQQSSIDNGAGSVEMSNMTLNDLAFSSGVGSTIYNGVLTGNSTISCDIGKTTFNLNGNLNDYDINDETGSGQITINGEAYTPSAYKQASAPNTLTLENGIGALNLQFK